MDDSADFSLINGTGNAADYDAVTGGSLAAAQNPFDAADNGTLNSSNTGTGGAPSAGVAAAPSSGSSATPPSWWSNLLGGASSLVGLAGTANTTAQQIIGGKPAVSPGQAGQAATTGPTINIGGQTFSVWTLALIGGAAAFIVWLVNRR